MARKPRLHYSGAFYHVILRGNGGNEIFTDNDDRARFFFLIQEGTERYKHRIHAYCLMTNHVHLAIQVGEVPLSRIVQNLSFRYTRYMNNRKKQVGHLFQGRYKAVLIDADSYLLELVRYIHNNPVRAGMVATPEKYSWSSHNAYLGHYSLPWLTTDWVLSQFAKQKKRAVKLYGDFVSEGMGEGRRTEFHKGNLEGRILGEDRFAEEALGKASQKAARKVPLEKVIQAVCGEYGILPDALAGKSRGQMISAPRSVVALLVRDTDHLSLMELGRTLQRDLSSLSQSASRLEKKIKDDDHLREKVNKIKMLIR